MQLSQKIQSVAEAIKPSDKVIKKKASQVEEGESSSTVEYYYYYYEGEECRKLIKYSLDISEIL